MNLTRLVSLTILSLGALAVTPASTFAAVTPQTMAQTKGPDSGPLPNPKPPKPHDPNLPFLRSVNG